MNKMDMMLHRIKLLNSSYHIYKVGDKVKPIICRGFLTNDYTGTIINITCGNIFRIIIDKIEFTTTIKIHWKSDIKFGCGWDTNYNAKTIHKWVKINNA